MRQGLITPAKRADRRDDVGATYPFSAQYKGDAWYVFDARTNGWGDKAFTTAAEAAASCASGRASSPACMSAAAQQP